MAQAYAPLCGIIVCIACILVIVMAMVLSVALVPICSLLERLQRRSTHSTHSTYSTHGETLPMVIVHIVRETSLQAWMAPQHTPCRCAPLGHRGGSTGE